MPEGLSTDAIIMQFVNRVHELTGIRIAKQDIDVVLKPNTLIIRAWECGVARVAYKIVAEEKEQLEEKIVQKAVNQIPDLRKKIIRCKIQHLSRSIPQWELEIKKSLMERNVSNTFVSALSFDIINHGYRYRHYSAVREAHYDYPFLAIKISDSDGFHFSYPINVYDVIDPIEMDELKHNLFIAILEQSINRRRDLSDL